MKYNGVVLALVCFISLTMLRNQGVEAVPLQCNYEYLSDAPQRIQKVCAALANLYRIGTAMENYINEEAPEISDELPRIPVRFSGIKRQDMDHVFLRFGKK